MRSALITSLTTVLIAAPAAHAESVPVLGAETPRGSGTTVALPADKPSRKTVDGRIGDWRGTSSEFAGVSIRSGGEHIYTDHLFDPWGADDGEDRDRLNRLGPGQEALPETYRLEALIQQDPAGQVGAPSPVPATTNYGDLERRNEQDLSEVRVSADEDELFLLARTTVMEAAGDTALLVLLDTADDDGAARTVPFGSGLTTTRAERALLLIGDRGWSADLASGAITKLPARSVATRPDGWDNAIELRLSRAGLGDEPRIAVATGRPAPDGSAALAAMGTGPAVANVANVAFRHGERVREWFDRAQAFALLDGTIDPFFEPIALEPLRDGVNERYVPGPGYHERHFRSSEDISNEKDLDGILQHYGIYFPKGWRPSDRSPLQLWLHWRGGTAHSAGAVIPRMFQDLGDEHDTIVVSPRGRGTSSWYVGRGQVDVEQVWADVHADFDIDPRRRYVAGHSMGGWGSWLMTILHPDWFAAALPASPPVTQGAWTGLDFEGCDQLRFDDYSPCYIQANDGDARAQHTRRLLENLRHVPIAVYHGTADELVPVSGVTRQMERMVALGYRHRYYLFHTQEHFGPPIWDQWAQGGRYMHRFRAPRRPARVSFVRDMTFERAIERVNNGGVPLAFDFDSAYWLRDLEPADLRNGRATFDGRSLALPQKPYLTTPEAGGPASPDNAGPYTMTGLRWMKDPLTEPAATSNGLVATFTGASTATLDGRAMGLDLSKPVHATITTDRVLRLTLTAPGKDLKIEVQPGTHDLELTR